MANKNAENKSAFENGIFLKVDCVEPVYKNVLSICGDGPYLAGIKVWIDGNGHFFECDRYTVCDPDAVREDGRRQAIVLMNEIFDMTGSERKEAFGKVTRDEIIRDASYEDLAKKLDNWKKEKIEIHVRDEVYSYHYKMQFVVTKILVPSGNEDATVNGLKKDGSTVKGILLCHIVKTGLHVDDLDAYLEV